MNLISITQKKVEKYIFKEKNANMEESQIKNHITKVLDEQLKVNFFQKLSLKNYIKHEREMNE
jgi:hypothetical protein